MNLRLISLAFAKVEHRHGSHAGRVTSPTGNASVFGLCADSQAFSTQILAGIISASYLKKIKKKFKNFKKKKGKRASLACLKDDPNHEF